MKTFQFYHVELNRLFSGALFAYVRKDHAMGVVAVEKRATKNCPGKVAVEKKICFAILLQTRVKSHERD
jgi:hypothetical protein